jgi:hypothetical protein
MTVPSPVTRRVTDNASPNYTFASRSRLDRMPQIRNASPTQSSSTASSSSSYPFSGDTGTLSSNTVLPKTQCGCGEATSRCVPPPPLPPVSVPDTDLANSTVLSRKCMEWDTR